MLTFHPKSNHKPGLLVDYFQECTMSWKNICSVLLIVAIYVYPLVADNGLERNKCFNSFKKRNNEVACLSKDLDSWQWKISCSSWEIPKLLEVFLHTPKQDETNRSSTCATSNLFFYNGTYNASCLMKASPEDTKNLLSLILDVLINKKNNTVVAEQFIQKNLFGLPNFSLLDLDYDCSNGPAHGAIKPYLDICENITMSDQSISTAQIFFNMTSFSSNANTYACFCKVTSTTNQSEPAVIRAVDVRLAGGANLNLSGRILSSQDLLWWNSDHLLSSSGEITIGLTKINPSAPPHAMWLEIAGKDLNIRCGVQHEEQREVFENSDDNKSIPMYAIVAGIFGSILVLSLIIIIVGICVCKRSPAKNKSYTAIGSKLSDLERLNSSDTSKSYPHKEEPMDTNPEISHIYFEVQPRSGEDNASEDSIKFISSPKDAKKKYHIVPQNGQDAMVTSQENNIYSHLREEKNVTQTDLYDTFDQDEYASLQKQQSTKVIGNIYDT